MIFWLLVAAFLIQWSTIMVYNRPFIEKRSTVIMSWVVSLSIMTLGLWLVAVSV